MGCNKAIDNECMPEELPFQEVELPDFYIDRNEVTVGEYRRCVTAGKCQLPKPAEGCNFTHEDRDNHPMNCVSNVQARDYCASVGKALPTEEQWEKAARGNDGRLYPWGNTFDPKIVTFRKEGVPPGTEPVGSHPENASPYGVLDMTGNVWEWTSTMYVLTTTPRTVDKNLKPYEYETQSWVFKGGSWDCDHNWPLRISGRTWSKPIRNTPILGFRCAKSTESK